MYYLDILLFILKYIPFWAVPIGLMSASFGYNFWLKDYRQMAFGWGAISLFCLTSTLLYFFIGGPDQIVETFTHVFK